MSGSKDNFRQSANDKIVEARIMTRPADGKAGEKYGVPHVGLQVKTDKGDSWLTHSTPGSGVKTTDANLSGRWQEVHKVDVCPDKSLGGVNKAAGANHLQDNFQNYMDNKTCVGAAGKAAVYLENCDRKSGVNPGSSGSDGGNSDNNRSGGGGGGSDGGCSIA